MKEIFIEQGEMAVTANIDVIDDFSRLVITMSRRLIAMRRTEPDA